MAKRQNFDIPLDQWFTSTTKYVPRLIPVGLTSQGKAAQRLHVSTGLIAQMSQAKVLVIDTDAARAAQLKSLLEFIDYDAVPAKPADALQAFADQKQIAAILVGDVGSDTDLKKLLQDLRKQDPAIALLLLVEKDAKPLER